MTSTPYLSMQEAADYLRLERITTLQALVRNKKVAYTKVGRQVVFKTEWLDEYADEHKVPVVTNPWGLTDSSLNRIRQARSAS